MAPFWLPLAPFWLALAPFYLTFGALWLTFGALGVTFVILATIFSLLGSPGVIFDIFGYFRWKSYAKSYFFRKCDFIYDFQRKFEKIEKMTPGDPKSEKIERQGEQK